MKQFFIRKAISVEKNQSKQCRKEIIKNNLFFKKVKEEMRET